MNKKAVRKELARVQKQEDKFIYRASESHSYMQEKINRIIPKKIYAKLDKAFGKAFNFIYSKGTKAIRKTYSEKKMKEGFEEDKRFAKAVNTGLGVKSFHAKSRRRGLLDGFIAGLAGIGLGIFGRGVWDIPIFVSITFRNMYETCLCYGFDSDDLSEKILMLKMMEAALTTGDEIEDINAETDAMIEAIDRGYAFDEQALEAQIESVSSKLSQQILYLKFLQIIPIVGGVIGFSDIIYLGKVHRYIDMKYRKRFLMMQEG